MVNGGLRYYSEFQENLLEFWRTNDERNDVCGYWSTQQAESGGWWNVRPIDEARQANGMRRHKGQIIINVYTFILYWDICRV